MANQNKKLCIITGASSGIGEATAKLLSKQGHPLLLISRRLENMQKLNLPNCICKQVDVCDLVAFKSAVEEAEAKFGPTDLLLANAGVMLLGSSDQQKIEEWNTMIDVNCKGVLNGIYCVIKGMKQRNTGTVITISSVAGKKLFPSHAVYCGTKFFVSAITEGMREELSGSNVRFIVIEPGIVETELLSHTTVDSIKEGYKAWKDGSLEEGKGLKSEDVANCIDFAYRQPQSVCIREICLAPTKQQQ